MSRKACVETLTSFKRDCDETVIALISLSPLSVETLTSFKRDCDVYLLNLIYIKIIL